MLKPVDKKKNPGLAKLPEKVRNKMGYAKKGKMMKAKSGNMAKIDKVVKGLNKASKLHQSQAKTLKTIKANSGKMMKDKFKITKENIEQIKEALKKRPKNLKTPKRVQFMSKAKTGKMMKANVGMAAQKVREKDMMKASMGKSVRGYGAARTSGMGLQDESLPPGKSLDYYKDLM